MPLVAQHSLPRVILGLMTFGPDTARGARITSLDEYKKCIDYLQQQGFNEVDTARVYVGGQQEGFTAKAYWKERGLSLATKYETLEAVNELYKKGKFVQLGLSNYPAFEVAEIVTLCAERGWVRPTIFQAMYNAITRNIESELIPVCRRYGLDFVIYIPLAGGLFSGKYTPAVIPIDGHFGENCATGANYRNRYFKDANFEALKIIQPVVIRHGLTLIETALRWVHHHSALEMSHGGQDGIILGVSRFEQLESNLWDVQRGPLPEEVVDALDKAWLVAMPRAPNYWHLDLKYTYDTQESLFKHKT